MLVIYWRNIAINWKLNLCSYANMVYLWFQRPSSNSDWLNGVLCRFQQYFNHITATAHTIDVFPAFQQYWAGAQKCLAQGHSHEKTQRIQCSSNPGHLDYKSYTLPLSHVGPLPPQTEAVQLEHWGIVDVLTTRKRDANGRHY